MNFYRNKIELSKRFVVHLVLWIMTITLKILKIYKYDCLYNTNVIILTSSLINEPNGVINESNIHCH